jgi:RNA polymerase sigma-70 factor (ECF subfamily)
VTDAKADPAFRTTRWSVVVAAGGRGSAAARDALATLCSTYWYPLYAFARRRGADRDAAADLVQGFFAALIEKDWAGDADPERGRFRAYLLTAFKRFRAKEHRRDAAGKRGGGRTVLALDFDDGEARYAADASADADPERAFERRWAMTLLARAFERTRREFEGAERAALFAALVPYLAGEGDARPQAEIAASLGMTENAVRVALHRLRARHRENLRAEIRDTVAADSDVEEEIRHLMQAVASG